MVFTYLFDYFFIFVLFHNKLFNTYFFFFAYLGINRNNIHIYLYINK